MYFSDFYMRFFLKKYYLIINIKLLNLYNHDLVSFRDKLKKVRKQFKYTYNTEIY